MFFDEHVERTLVAYIVKDGKYANMSQNVLKPEMFEFPNIRRIYAFCRRASEKWHATVTYDMFYHALKSQNLSAQDETNYLLLFQELQAMEVEADKFQYYMDMLKDLKIKRDLFSLVNATQQKIGTQDGEETLHGLIRSLNDIKIDVNMLEVKKQFVYENVEERIRAYELRKQQGEVPGIPYGWLPLDQFTGGHFPGELTLVFARTGVGKTRTLANFAFNASGAGYDGLFITIEMSNLEIARLNDARACRLHYEKLKKGHLTPEEEQKWISIITKMEREGERGFYMIDMPRGCTTSAVEEEINLYERQYGKLDVVFVDYLALMHSEGKWKDSSERYGQLSQELKQLARVKNVSVMTAAQANRKATDVEGVEVGTEHIALSDQVAANCNNVIYLYRTDEDTLKNTLQANLVKYRDGGNKAFMLYTKWENNIISDAPSK